MSKSLKTLIKISKNEVDRLQKELAELVKLQDFYRSHIAIFREQIANESKLSNENFENHEIASALAKFIIATNDKIDMAQSQVDKLEIDISAKRDVLKEAFSEQKKFEIVQATNLENEQYELNRKVGNRLDEIGISTFIRNEQNEQDPIG